MRINITALLPVIGFCGRLPDFDLGREAPSHEEFYRQKKIPAEIEAGGPDAYKLAVLLLIGAAIFSLL
jgi:hypothetical protein